jgi:hypothetical protein
MQFSRDVPFDSTPGPLYDTLAAVTDLAAAKKRLVDALGDEPWVSAIGIGLVGTDRQKGLIVSLGEGAPAGASERIATLIPGVPFQVRGLRHVHKLDRA